MTWLVTFSIIVLSFSLIFAMKVILNKAMNKDNNNCFADILNQIANKKEEIVTLIREAKDCVSKKQLENVSSQIKKLQKGIKDAKDDLVRIDAELKEQQEKNNKREIFQQELKVSKEKDEEELKELLAGYDKISTESFELEKVLASKINEMEKMTKISDFTNGQRDYVVSYKEILGETARNLRGLITEYGQMTNRVSALKEQVDDIELEYSKLIESRLENDGNSIISNEVVEKEE